MSEKRADLNRRRAGLPPEKQALFLQRLRGAGPSREQIPGAPETETFEPGAGPVSFQQEGLLFLEKYYPGLPQYNIPILLRLRGALRPKLLSLALDSVISRHDALRSRFHTLNGTLRQTVAAYGQSILQVVDLSQLPESQREQQVMSLALDKAKQPADFASGPMMSAALYRVSANEYFLSFVVHHVVFDGWSVSVFLHDLAECYNNMLDGNTWRPRELRIRYVDYCAAQRKHVKLGAFQKDLAYWKNALKEQPPELEFLRDSLKTPSTVPAGNLATSLLSHEITDKLLVFCRERGVTPFATLLATWKAVLHKYSGVEDIWVGSASAGRNSGDVEPLVGFFVNTLIIRTSVQSNLSFAQLVDRVSQNALEALEHRELPFEILVQHLAPRRAPGKVPMIETMFVVQNTPSIDLQLKDVDCERVQIHNGTAKFPLTLQVFEECNRVRLELEYDARIIDANMASRLLAHFERLLDDGLTYPLKAISALSMLSEEEKHLLFFEWNSTLSAYPRDATVARIFEENVAHSPRATAIESGGECLTYGELNTQANRLGNYLVTERAIPGSIVAVCTEDIVDYVAVVLAILKAGCTYLPLDPAIPRRRNSEILRNASPVLLLASQRVSDAFSDSETRVITIEDAKERSLAYSEANLQTDATSATSVAYVMYTSGSTGEPKGVCVPHRAILRLVLNTNYISIQRGHRVAQSSNSAFDASTFEIWGALLNGAAMVGVPRTVLLSPRDLKEFLRQKRVDAMWVTVGLFNRIIAAQPDAFASVGTLISGGDVLSPTRVKQMLETGPPKRFLNGYGPTECTTFATWYEVRSVSSDTLAVPIGAPISNTRVHVLGPNLELLPIGVPGELCVEGDGLAVGYWRDAELTRKKFVSISDGDLRQTTVYRTGDVVRRREDGILEFIGRVDSQIKLRGFRIELEEIERALRAVPGVRDAAVTVRQLNAESKELVAYFVADAEDGPDVEKIRTALSNRLPDYMVPSLFIRMTDFPLNSNGKVDKRALPEPSRSRTAYGGTTSAPATEVEKRLAAIWTEILGRHDIGLSDNFFDVGGDSLLTICLQQRIEEHFRVQLSVHELFEHPRLNSQALRIQRRLSGDQSKPEDSVETQFMVPLRSEGSRPPLFFVTGAGDVMGIYGTLVSLLDSDQPFFGFPDPMYTSLSNEQITVELLAEVYLREVRGKQPKGPYYLGGYSVGGVVAFEMARRLHESGDEVAKLVVLDSAPPERRRQDRATRWRGTGSKLASTLALLYRRRRIVALDVRILLRFCLNRGPRSSANARTAPSMLDYILWSLRDIKQRDVANEEECTNIRERTAQLRMLEDPHLYRRYRSSRSARRALQTYEFPSYSGQMTVIHAEKGGLSLSESDSAFGWGNIAHGGVVVRSVPGTHTSVFKRPDVESLARTLNDCLREAK